LTGALAEICRCRLLAEKWLLAPTLRIGYQWITRIVRSGLPVANLHVRTISSLAFDLASPLLAEKRLKRASSRVSLLLVDRALRRVRREGLAYLSEAAEGGGITEAIHETLRSLRLAGVTPRDLEKGIFEVDSKGGDIRDILEAYLELLESEGLCDYADILNLASGRLRSGDASLREDLVVLLPSDIEQTVLEGRMLACLPEGALLELPVDEPAVPEDLQKDRLEMRISSTVGEVNEVRGALRSCLARGIPLDEAEILYTDRDTYVPLIYETLLELGIEPEDGGPPVTFAEGLPCSYTRPGRALREWLKWRALGYPQSLLTGMIRGGLLEGGRGKSGGRASHWRLAGLFRSLAIGYGRDRYRRKIGEKIKALEARLAGPVPDVSDGDDPTARPRTTAEELDDMKALRKMVGLLLDCTPGTAGTPGTLVSSARRFMEECVRSADMLDGFASRKLQDELEEMERWMEEEGDEAEYDVLPWLENLSTTTRVSGKGARPGMVHAALLHRGGHSGRSHTFVLGLDDSRFPGAGLQDPLLLDGERRSISAGLQTSGSRLKEAVESFQRLLARLRGEVTLSFSQRDVTEDREMFPSSAILALSGGSAEASAGGSGEYRLKPSGIHSFAPARSELCLSPTEWWAWRLTGEEQVTSGEEILKAHFPHLTRGLEARAARAGRSFTPWDGCVPRAGKALDPRRDGGPPVSANSLQTAAACPRRYFFRYALDVTPPGDLAADPHRWLDPLEKGSLLHELFERFMRSLVEEGRPPSFDRDRERMENLLNDIAERYVDRVPVPSDLVYFRERAELDRVAGIFLKEEEMHQSGTGSVPLFLEASLGLSPVGGGSSIDTTDPVIVDLPGGGSVRARGRIDRVDRIGGEESQEYAVWDYKSGSSWGYRRADPHRRGRKIQPWLYVQMLSRHLREVLSPGITIGCFGFFFPGLAASGERISWPPDRLEGGGEIMERICRLVGDGVFVATDDYGEDCRYCDYRPVCGDDDALKELSFAVKGKLEHAANVALSPFRQLRQEGE
jgi:hypothetical protein